MFIFQLKTVNLNASKKVGDIYPEVLAAFGKLKEGDIVLYTLYDGTQHIGKYIGGHKDVNKKQTISIDAAGTFSSSTEYNLSAFNKLEVVAYGTYLIITPKGDKPIPVTFSELNLHSITEDKLVVAHSDKKTTEEYNANLDDLVVKVVTKAEYDKLVADNMAAAKTGLTKIKDFFKKTELTVPNGALLSSELDKAKLLDAFTTYAKENPAVKIDTAAITKKVEANWSNLISTPGLSFTVAGYKIWNQEGASGKQQLNIYPVAKKSTTDTTGTKTWIPPTTTTTVPISTETDTNESSYGTPKK